MGFITNNWEGQSQKESLSQRVLDKVKPDVPLKNKIDFAQRKLDFQISKLNTITEKLQKKNEFIFKKIVEAQKTNSHSYARAYAVELHEIRKMSNMINNAKLSMEQIKIRLNTVSELGDVVVTLSPCMSIIKGLGTSLGGIMPEANASMQDLTSILGNVLTNSSMNYDQTAPVTNHESADTLAILQEAQAVIEGQARSNIPEIPKSVKESQNDRQEEII